MTTFEEIIAQQGTLVYTNTGNSMMPLLRQHRDLLVIQSLRADCIDWMYRYISATMASTTPSRALGFAET